MIDILLDTDIGGDIDDALALALALNSPQINIAGITTVYLAAKWRAGVIRRMLDAFERKGIPIALGAEKPLIGLWDNTLIPDSGKAADRLEGILPCPACDFIIDKAGRAEDLTIVAIGPLTNLALALSKAPQIAGRCKILLMGGQLNRAHPEWNILCDPEAARIVFESGAPITMVGLDVTNRCRFTREDMDYIASKGNARTSLLSDMLETFMEKFKFLPVLHDPLALSSLLWDDILTFEDKTVLIETKGEFTRGCTVDCDWMDKPNVRAAVDVREGEFKARLLDVITR